MLLLLREEEQSIPTELVGSQGESHLLLLPLLLLAAAAFAADASSGASMSAPVHQRLRDAVAEA